MHQALSHDLAAQVIMLSFSIFIISGLSSALFCGMVYAAQQVALRGTGIPN